MEVERFGQVGLGLVVDSSVSEEKNFKWKFLKDGGDVVVEMGGGEQTGSAVLNVPKVIQDL